jgi:hypothetical protein
MPGDDMTARNRLAVLLGAAALAISVASVTIAAPPKIYSIRVQAFADPTTVPPGGGTVTFSAAVSNNGTGTFQQVAPESGLAACVLTGPTGDQATGSGKGKLEPGETWLFSCTVDGVMPGTQNTVTVTACQNNGACGTRGDASGTDTVTVQQGADPSPTPQTPAP